MKKIGLVVNNKGYIVSFEPLTDYKYKVKINRRSYLIKLEETDYGLVLQYKEKKFGVALKRKSYNRFEVFINGIAYDVELESLHEPTYMVHFEGETKERRIDIRAPAPGIIGNIFVKEGKKVKKGDSLILLLTMKTENIISAPEEGVIKKIYVNKNQTVNEGELLIDFFDTKKENEKNKKSAYCK